MYEARRQRSSWARIKLSIVRKVYLISVSLQSFDSFFCCPFIRFWINKFFNIVHTILCLLILLSMCKCARSFLNFSTQDFPVLLNLLFIISISVLFRPHSRDYSTSSLSPLTVANRWFPHRTFPSYRFNNYCQLNLLHFVTSALKSFYANIIFRLIGICGFYLTILKCKSFFLYAFFNAHYSFYHICFLKSRGSFNFFSFYFGLGSVLLVPHLLMP